MEIPQKKLLSMYRMMVKIRMFESRVSELFTKGLIPGFVHLSSGQEGVIVGTDMALDHDDYLLTSHRCHGDALAKGIETKKLMAELLGRETGTNHGFGGSLHIADYSNSFIGANSIVGAGLPVATGAALAQKLNGLKHVHRDPLWRRLD